MLLFWHILTNKSNCAVEGHEGFTVMFSSVAEQGKIGLVVEATIPSSSMLFPSHLYVAFWLILANQSNCAAERHELFTVLFSFIAEQGKISLVVEATFLSS